MITITPSDIQHLHQQLSASTLILDLFTATHGKDLALSAILKAGHLFDMSGDSIRVALQRLVRGGRVIKIDRGLYRLNASFDVITHDVLHWRARADNQIAWNGSWVGVCDTTIPRSKRTAWRKHQRALDLRGFKTLESGLHVRPFSFKNPFADFRNSLFDLGLASGSTVVQLSSLEPSDYQYATQLWAPKDLEKTYQKALRALQLFSQQLDQLPLEKAACDSLIVGHHYIRQMIRDPFLPPEMLSIADRTRLFDLLITYQDRAILIWLQIMN